MRETESLGDQVPTPTRRSPDARRAARLRLPPRSVKDEMRANLIGSPRVRAADLPGHRRLRRHGPAGHRERHPRRPGHHASWASAARPRRASRARWWHCSTTRSRSSPAASSTTTRSRRSRRTRAQLVATEGDQTPDRLAAARPPLRREAGHAGHHDRRPDRRGRPDQGRRGPLPRRRADHPLRPRAAHQPRHLRHQRAARPRRAHPGRPAQHPRGARRPGPRLHAAPAARPVRGRQRQPGGLHQPRPDHHAAQGPLRLADPDALPAHDRGRDRDHGPGAHAARRARASRS